MAQSSLLNCKPPTTPSRPSLSKDSPSKPRNAQVTDSSSVEQPVVSLRTASQLQLNNLNHGQQKISIVDLEASIFCVKNGLEFDVCKDHHGGGVHAMAVHGGGAEPPATPEKVEEPAPDCAQRAPWLRAALLGGNDGLVSTASLLMGVGAVKEDMKSMVITGLAGLVAGACSMAIGEFVSVYSQRDLEVSQVKRECSEFQKGGPEARAKKLEELVDVFVQRGLSSGLARQVAEELSKGDDVAKVHVQERLGINVDELANPLQAALASAVAFSVGAMIPLLSAAFIRSYRKRLAVVVVVSTIALAVFGAAGAKVGRAPIFRAAARVVMGGWAAMAITYGLLMTFGTAGM